MRRLVFALLFGLGGYVLGAVLGYALVGVLSSNAHDKSLEAAMTGAFFTGPAGAVIGAILGAAFGGRR
jgi:hypothetical protein